MATTDRTITAERLDRAMGVVLGHGHRAQGHKGVPAQVCDPCKLYTMSWLVWYMGCWPRVA